MEPSASARGGSASPLLLISSERFADHVTPPGHPERVARADVFSGVASRWHARGGLVAEPRPASGADLGRVHDERYLEQITRTAGHATRLDPDTYTSPESCDVAALAAGAVLVAVDHAIAHGGPAFALVRPPGHHAEREAAMGFCLLNNVAVGAAYARSVGMARVAVVDFDVHHGNGTQWMFYEDPTVLYASVHQYPYYPGTGGPDEVGRGPGLGFTANVGLRAGATDADYDAVFAEMIVPLLDAFAPDLLMVSAGFDADQRDPLASMNVTTAGFAAVVCRLWAFACDKCQGRLVAVSEGGYDLTALREGIEAVVEVLSHAPVPTPRQGGDPFRARQALTQARLLLRPYWPTL